MNIQHINCKSPGFRQGTWQKRFQPPVNCLICDNLPIFKFCYVHILKCTKIKWK